MNLPPYLMRLHIYNKSHPRRLRLWIPLFLFWPFIAVFLLILAPLALILTLVLWPFGWGKPFLMAGPVIYSCLCNMRGLEIDSQQGQEQFRISIY